MKKVIIDCDTGIDDSMALMLALSSKEIDVIGITTVSGNIEVNAATENTFQVLKLMGRVDIPVYKGESMPLKRVYHDATDTHGKDGLGETFYPKTGLKAKDGHAVDFILDTIKRNPGEITLVALGPLTNIAKAIEKDKNVMSMVKEFIFMGGAAEFHGNCSPVAEYNFWVDPEAADEVIRSGFAKGTMVGLDVTHQIILSPNLREVINQIGGKRGKFIHDITRFYVDFHWKQERTLGCVINDPLVIAMLIDKSLVECYEAFMEVETEGIAAAQTVCDKKGLLHGGKINANVAYKVDPRKFFDIFMKNLFPDESNDIEMSLNREFGE